MEVTDVQRILGNVVAEVVGLTVDSSSLAPASSHPHREASRMVISAVIGLAEATLTVNGSPELSAPNNQGIIEHTPLFQVVDEGVAWSVNVSALRWHSSINIPVVIPVVVVNLDETDISFGQPAGHQGNVRKAPGLAGLLPIKFESPLWFLGQVSELGHAGLHAGSHLILLDPGEGLGVSKLLKRQFVHFIDALYGALANRIGNPCRIIDIEDRITLAAEGDPSVFPGEVAA